MSRKTRMQSAREAKDRRAKIMAIGGAVLLAIVLAFEMPHYLGGKKSATPAATTSAASVGSTTPGATPAATTAGVTPAAATPTSTTPLKLTNSDLPPRHSKDQLANFSRFASKDPFVQQVKAVSTTAGGSGSSSTTAPQSGSTASHTTAPNNASLTAARSLAHSGAVMITVNGKRQSVKVGASFPSSNPTFMLVSLSRAGARIGIANGSYSSGAQTILLRLNRAVTLVDSTNGVRYKLQLLGS